MTEALHDLSTPNLVVAIEQNLYSFMDVLRCWPRATVHDEPGMAWSITDLRSPLFNSIMRTRLASDAVDAAIEAVIKRATSRNVPVSWWTGPASRPADLGMHLRRHGFGEPEVAPGMAIDLAGFSASHPMPPGMTVEVARDGGSLRQWGVTCLLGFGASSQVADREGAIWADLLSHADPANVVAYLGCKQGEPVGTSMLMYGAGVAGIYCVATVPEARRQGIGAAMTSVPLGAAKAAGYAAGILQASEMGVGVYRSLGFHEYCKIYEYIWRPSIA